MGDDVIGDHHMPPVVIVVLMIFVVGDGGLGCSMPTTMMPPLPPLPPITTIITVVVMSLPGARDAAAADYAYGDHCGDHHRYHC